jgi:hypothetical protein
MLLAEALTAYTAGVDALLTADIDTVPLKEALDAYVAIETASRRVPMAGYALLARLDREADTGVLGATSLWQALTLRCRMSKGQAVKRCAWARTLIGRRTLQGEQLAPEWEHTAAAHARGDISDEHVEVIRKFLDALPSRVDPAERARAEKTLAEAATTLDPRGLTAAAIHLLAYLHPDGEAPAEEVARKVGLTLGPQQPDGTRYIRGWVSPRLAAFLEPIVAKFGERRRHHRRGTNTRVDDEPTVDETDIEPTAEEPTLFNEPEPEPAPQPEPEPDDPSAADNVVAEDNPSTPDPDDLPFPPTGPLPRRGPLTDEHGRSKSQYLHDAVEAAFDLLLRSQTLGTLNGLPTTIVVTTTLQDLLRGAGYAVTGGGTRLPIRDLIALAARGAYHYLEVFDDHTGEILHFGRAKRCATGAQKLALFGRDRGCTCPGCTVDFYRTQAHHGVADWKADGQTNVNDLTLACGGGNQMIEDTDWTTRRRPDGRFVWVDPDGTEHLNNLHHPERLLAPRDEDDDPF